MIKGIILDYGGTLDSEGMHWSDVIASFYRKNKLNLSKQNFWNAYVHTERFLATHNVIKSNYNFFDTILKKIEFEFMYLIDNKVINNSTNNAYIQNKIAKECYEYAKKNIQRNLSVIKYLHDKYPLVLVTNFYGNINAILSDFQLKPYFTAVVESANVGVRKPNPEIFKLGISKLGTTPAEIVVIGDSYEKDILPAQTCGCHTIWINNQNQIFDGRTKQIHHLDEVIKLL